MSANNDDTNFPQLPLAMSRRNVEIHIMSFRVPILRVAAAFAVATLASSATRAQDTTDGEVMTLRKMVEQQAKQIESLSAQLAKLKAKIEDPATPVAPKAPTAPAENSGEFAAPAARVVAPPAPAANVHIVVKGESLEKIAKAYGTTTPDLMKLNRIKDPKKLQIGQQLTLPPQPQKK